MAVLPVGAPLPCFHKSQPVEDGDHLSRLQNGYCAHASAHKYGLGAHELAFELGFSILEQELDDFDKIPVEFIE
jgi:hypothetical protein